MFRIVCHRLCRDGRGRRRLVPCHHSDLVSLPALVKTDTSHFNLIKAACALPHLCYVKDFSGSTKRTACLWEEGFVDFVMLCRVKNGRLLSDLVDEIPSGQSWKLGTNFIPQRTVAPFLLALPAFFLVPCNVNGWSLLRNESLWKRTVFNVCCSISKMIFSDKTCAFIKCS